MKQVASANKTEALAQFIVQTSYEQLPEALRAKLKDCLLDALGCAAYGSKAPWLTAVREVVREAGGRPEATAWFQGLQGPAAQVALLNGSAVHAYWLDDVHNAKVHPGAAVIPAAVALAERRPVTGKELLTALAVGYETNIRVSLAAGPAAMRLQGWQPASLTGVFGAAAAAARILGLPAEGTVSALGLAGGQAGGSYAFSADGSPSERLHMGWAAMGGVLAALLAGQGMAGPREALEADDGGFCRLFTREPDWESLTGGLGEEFLAIQTALKPYPVCGSLIPYVQAAIDLGRERPLAAGDVERVRAYVARLVQVQCGLPYRQLGVLHAQENLRFCVAAALLNGAFTPEHLQPHWLSHPEVLRLIPKVELVLDAELDAQYPAKFMAVLEVELRDGSSRKRRVEEPSGSAHNPLSHQDVVDKFLAQTVGVLGEARAQNLRRFIEELDRQESLEPLQNLWKG